MSPDLLKAMLKESGTQVQDERILAVTSVLLESQMLKIVQEMKTLQGSSSKPHFQFDDLQKAMSEFGVAIKRPPFLSEK